MGGPPKGSPQTPSASRVGCHRFCHVFLALFALSPRRAEAAGAAGAFGECVDLDDVYLLDALDHQLGDAVAAREGDWCRGIVVDEDDADLAAIACVDQAGRVDEAQPVAQREAGARQDEAGVAVGQRHRDAGADGGARAGCQRHALARVEVETGVVLACIGGQRKIAVEALHEHADGSAQRLESARSRSVLTTHSESRRTISLATWGRFCMSQSRRSLLMTISSTSVAAMASAERGASRNSARSPTSSPSPSVDSTFSTLSNVRLISTVPAWIRNASPFASAPSLKMISPALNVRRSRSPSVRFL